MSKPYSSAICATFLRAFAMSSVPAGPHTSSPSTMFSVTVKFSTSMKCWWTMPMPCLMAVVGSVMSTFSPLMKTSPSSAW